MQKEGKYIEYKETVSKTFLKAVSAFANYNDGKIIFGVCDDGLVKGLPDANKACLDIENAINDSITPVPENDIVVNERNKTVILNIYKGSETPYFYHGKAYRRSDTASVPVDTVELKRLVLKGTNRDFEDLPASSKELSFSVFEKELKNTLQIDEFDKDIQKTLGLYVKDVGYNIAAELLSDKNDYRGIDIIRFGETEDRIMDRETFEHQSIIAEYNSSIEVYRKYYQYDEIKGIKRETIEMIPKLAEAFLKLNYIEKFGTGVRRIINAYKNEYQKPEFSFTEHTICVTLPVIEKNKTDDMAEIVLKVIVGSDEMTRKEIEEITGIKKATLIRILNKLLNDGIIRKKGLTRNTRYYKN